MDWTPTVNARLRGKCGGGFFNDVGFEEIGFAGGREGVADFCEAEVNDFLAGLLEEIVGRADNELEVLALVFARGGMSPA